ncbi:hypothetical protein PVK06_027498 [Gossypium arboreum]|uniref:Uncharacterized protein n=1 Tax=Gossypium arboreum TaxID=29729 RepID=A0ABR0P0I8_GOSAR|nr:hypothetical protein PVK06_027498 [Gossypium arboreum]
MANFVNQKKMIARIFFLESMELDEIEMSCSLAEMYSTELNIHNTCEGDMGSKEKSCEKTERKETLNGKSLLDGPNLVNENPYEDFKDPLMNSQLYYSTIARPFYLWERAKVSEMNLCEEGGMIRVTLSNSKSIIEMGLSKYSSRLMMMLIN